METSLDRLKALASIPWRMGLALALAALGCLPAASWCQNTDSNSQLSGSPKVTWSRSSDADDGTYAARVLNVRRVHDRDPNIWVYTAQFAERFKMPADWISPDLHGVQAVAFRLEPTYGSCGWGGNQNACREDATECVMDVYFDNTQDPLPWDDKARVTDFDLYPTSAHFLFFVRRLARSPGDVGIGVRTPFSDPKTGKELTWLVPMAGSTGIFAFVGGYDRNIDENLSFIKLRLLSCGDPIGLELRLSVPPKGQKEAVYRSITLPESWRERVRAVVLAVQARENAHFQKVFEDMKKQPQSAH